MPPRSSRLVAALVAVAALSGCANGLLRVEGQARAPEGPTLAGSGGSVMLVGGGLKDDNADVFQAMRRHARPGAERPKVAVFCTARDSLAKAREAYEQDDATAMGYKSVFEHHGFEPVFVPIAIDNYRTASVDPALVKLVEGCDLVWFGGGAQNLHARCLLTGEGQDTPLMQAVRKVYFRGGLVGGTSAGAAIMDEFTYGDGTSHEYLRENRLAYRPVAHFSDARQPLGDGRTGGYTTGFGFLGGIDAGVDTHTDARGRYGRLLVAMRVLRYEHGIALSENTGLLVRGKRGKVFGTDRVFVACAEQAAFSPAAPFEARGVRLHSLARHDEIDFERHAVASSRPAVSPDQAAPAPVTDVLKGDALLTSMEGFVKTPAAEAALPAGAAPRFTFTLKKGPATRGYQTPGDRPITVEAVELTVSATAAP